MFGFLKKKTASAADQPYLAAQHTNTPLDNHMTRLFAEELPMLDSAERAKVYRALEAYDGPTITSQEQLPEEIRQIMDL